MPVGLDKIFQSTMLYEESGGSDIDLKLKSSIEAAVVKWSSICSDVMKQSSRIAFAGGVHPTPMREVEFWSARLKNLECIYDQLRDPRVKKMIMFLENTESTYLPCFKTTFKGIVACVIEARDINLYLKPMISHFLKFEENEFLDNEPNIKPLLHVCGLLWANSRYYCTSSKIVTLLREIGKLKFNIFHEKTLKFLSKL